MKVETVSRGREIADMREVISKLEKEKEAEKNKKVPKKDKVVQTKLVVWKVTATQTTIRTYASVAAQVAGVSESKGESTDKMYIDLPGSPKRDKTATTTRRGREPAITPRLRPPPHR